MFSSRSLGAAVIGLVIFGILYRLWPIVAGMPLLANFFVTEDGYLMLTVARNMAIGNGMSVSDGTIPTNGVQPLATFLFAIPYLITDGDKVSSLIGIHAISAAVSLAGFFLVRAFAARLLAPHNASPAWPWAVALLWLLAPHLLRHSMNGLETALYTCAVVLLLIAFARLLEQGDAATTRTRLGVGALCGIAVLARNDAVFLVTAVFLVWAGWELFVEKTSFGTMLARLIPPGLLSILVAAPWLINNQVKFGSIVPISGTAQSLDAEFGQNAALLPTKIFEYVFPMLPVPSSMETTPWVMAVAGGATAIAMLVFLWSVVRHGSVTSRALVTAYLLHGAAIATYYGLFFGAPHFMSRYLAPLAPLLITAGLIAALTVGRWLLRSNILAGLYATVGVVLSVGLLLRALMPGVTVQGHEQVVDWVSENVPEDPWIAAVQTGTLGYWHDRTLNLDGKVNPQALEARKQSGSVLSYILESEIDYVVDWAGVGNWVKSERAKETGFAEAFELVLQDYEADISVMRRIEPRHRE